jgi:hypothetical protein
MLKLLERNIESIGDRLVLLAPGTTIPDSLENITVDSGLHASYLRQLQRLRGRIYLNDGALRSEQLTRDGRHETPEDPDSWHLMVLDDDDQVSGCIWYLAHEKPSFDQLRIRHSAIAHDPAWSGKLRSAVENDFVRARQQEIHYAEVGGWAVAESSRLTDCLLLILTTFGLSQLLGGAFVAATATLRHSSAPVLRRMGGARFKGENFEVPSYFDPSYECEMELLQFDTRRPAPRFAWMVDALKRQLTTLPVFARECRDEVFALKADRVAPPARDFRRVPSLKVA